MAWSTKVLSGSILRESSHKMKEGRQDVFCADIEKESAPHAVFVYPEIAHF